MNKLELEKLYNEKYVPLYKKLILNSSLTLKQQIYLLITKKYYHYVVRYHKRDSLIGILEAMFSGDFEYRIIYSSTHPNTVLEKQYIYKILTLCNIDNNIFFKNVLQYFFDYWNFLIESSDSSKYIAHQSNINYCDCIMLLQFLYNNSHNSYNYEENTINTNNIYILIFWKKYFHLHSVINKHIFLKAIFHHYNKITWTSEMIDFIQKSWLNNYDNITPSILTNIMKESKTLFETFEKYGTFNYTFTSNIFYSNPILHESLSLSLSLYLNKYKCIISDKYIIYETGQHIITKNVNVMINNVIFEKTKFHVKKLMMTKYSIGALLENGNMYVCGSLLNGRIGIEINNDDYPTNKIEFINKMQLLNNDNIYIIDACLYDEGGLLLTNQGLLYTFGISYLNTTNQILYKPTCIKYDNIINKQFISIYTSNINGTHFFAKTMNQQYYCWGNNLYGQLGISNISSNYDLNMNSIYNENGYTKYIIQPILHSWLSSMNILNIVLGLYHTVLLTTDNLVYICGCNKYHLCGINNQEFYITKFTLIPFIEELQINIINIYVSNYVTILQNMYGSIYIFGKNIPIHRIQYFDENQLIINKIIPSLTNGFYYFCSKSTNILLFKDIIKLKLLSSNKYTLLNQKSYHEISSSYEQQLFYYLNI